VANDSDQKHWLVQQERNEGQLDETKSEGFEVCTDEPRPCLVVELVPCRAPERCDTGPPACTDPIADIPQDEQGEINNQNWLFGVSVCCGSNTNRCVMRAT